MTMTTIGVMLISLLLQQTDPEVRIVDYLKANVKPGQNVIVSDLVNNVFKAPEEQAALQRMFNTFFKIPNAVAEYYTRTGKIPTLEELGGQFSFKIPGEMDVMLRIMESDRRVPKFLERDPKTGEITRVDVEAIKANPRFGRELERTLAGWEGKTAPDYSIMSFAGQPLTSAQVKGKAHAVYFWFTDCPPCVKTAPLLEALSKKYAGQGFEVVSANADHVLELSYTDKNRADYVKKLGITFTTGHLTPEMQAAYGGISVFPTLFFVNKQGTVTKQFVAFQDEKVLEASIQEALK